MVGFVHSDVLEDDGVVIPTSTTQVVSSYDIYLAISAHI